MNKKWLFTIVIIVLIVGGIWLMISSSGASQLESKFKSHSKHAPSIGKKEADNTIYVLADFSCPYCKAFEQKMLPEINDKYIKSKKTNIKFINASLLGDDSVYKSVVSYAILEKYPDKYWDFNKAMYDEQGNQGQTKTDIKSTSKKHVKEVLNNLKQQQSVDTAMTQSGLNTNQKDKVKAAAKNPNSKAWDKAIKDRTFAKKLHVKTIPSVYINGKKVDDYRDTDSYEKYLE